MPIVSCQDQVITFTVSFCEHSHTFVKNAEFVMVNGVKGIPVEIAQLTSSLPYPCTHVITWVHNMSLLDHCLGSKLLELITTCHHCRPPAPLSTPVDPYFTCNRTGENLEYFLQNIESFLFELVVETFNIRVKGVLCLSNLKIDQKDVKHIDEY